MKSVLVMLVGIGLWTLPAFGEPSDLTIPGWNTQAAPWPQPADGSPFVPPADDQTTAYRQGMLSIGPGWQGPIWHQMGYLPLALKAGGTDRLGVNIFAPPGKPRGTLLFLHGYMARAADFPFTLAWFASRGWVVVTLDLPGHGLSDGPRNDIDAFSTYGDAVSLWLDWAGRQGWPGPRVLVTHSLGAAATLEALRRPGAPTVDQIVFCAPLLRTTWYPALVVADTLIGGWLPGLFSADYQARAHWFFALEDWLKTLDGQPPLNLKLTVYAGTKDSVVEGSWNREKLLTLVPAARWVDLPGKDHWFMEDPADRLEFHERLEADLEAQGY